MPNGVSFSLVAGAFVCVRFSNRHMSTQLVNKTLNVSSTGAKTMQGSYQGAYNQNDGGFDGNNTNTVFFCYSGSAYNFMGDYYRNGYSDSD